MARLLPGVQIHSLSSIDYVNKIFENLLNVDPQQVEAVYHDVRSAGAVIPSGEGRSKGALSIACSEMAKTAHGKIVLDRGDIGFPGRDLAEAAPVLRRRYGQVCLLINSESGRSLLPLLDAQKLGTYVAASGEARDFRMDLVTADAESPLGKLSSKYGNLIVLKGREGIESPAEPREFRAHGIMDDMFTLASGMLFHSMAEVMAHEVSSAKILPLAKELSSEAAKLVDDVVNSDFFAHLLDALEQRKSCFFAGLGSSQEVVRMTAVRIGHVKRAVGDQVYVAGDSNTPSPRAGDLLIVVSHSGETEVVAGWCRNFKKMGGEVACIVGTSENTIASLSDASFVVPAEGKPGFPNRFYVKTAVALSPLPIYLVERFEEKGLKLPEYILRWHRSVIS